MTVTGPGGALTTTERHDGGEMVKLDVSLGSTTWTVTVTSGCGNAPKGYAMTVKRNPLPTRCTCAIDLGPWTIGPVPGSPNSVTSDA